MSSNAKKEIVQANNYLIDPNEIINFLNYMHTHKHSAIKKRSDPLYPLSYSKEVHHFLSFFKPLVEFDASKEINPENYLCFSDKELVTFVFKVKRKERFFCGIVASIICSGLLEKIAIALVKRDGELTRNQDGTYRKIRENKATNFKWTPENSFIAYLVYRVNPNSLVRREIAKKFDISLEALNTRANEFQIIENKGNIKRVSKLSHDLYKENVYRSLENCEDKLNEFIEGNLDYHRQNIVSLKKNEQTPNVSHEVNFIPTKNYLKRLKDDIDLEINGQFFNQENLVLLKDISDLDFIESKMEGCYFIFSTLPIEKVPAFSKDGYQCFEHVIEKDGKEFRCIYNGKGNSVKERLKVHLFSGFTLEKVLSSEKKRINGTGALSLEAIDQDMVDRLKQEGKFITKSGTLKPVKKSIKDVSVNKFENDVYFLNGIDITEPKWSDVDFAIVVIKSDSEFGKILIEEAFCYVNGRPPLCKRHG